VSSRVKARVTPEPSTCHPLVRAHLRNVASEGTRTPRVWDSETPKDLGYIIIESPKGPKVPKCQSRSYSLAQGGTWQ
jgi:hypothetical protein